MLVQNGLRDGVIERTSRKDVRWASTAFPIPKKKKGTWRLLLNLKILNTFIQDEPFQMPGLPEVLDLLTPNAWMSQFDVTEAFHHLEVKPSFRPFLSFQHKGRWYRYRTCPMGLCVSPRRLHTLLQSVMKELRRAGVAAVLYVDDGLLVFVSTHEASIQWPLVAHTLASLGIHIKGEKCIIRPTQRIEFLGWILDTKSFTIELPADKVRKLTQAAQTMHGQLRHHPSSVTARLLSRLIGQLIAASAAIFGARAHMSGLMSLLYSILRRTNSYEGVVHPSDWGYDRAMIEAKEWAEHLSHWHGRGILQRPAEHILDTDASGYAYGAVLARSPMGPWSLQARFTGAERRRHITFKELAGATRSLAAFIEQKDLRDTSILLRTDNTCAASYLRRMGGKLISLTMLTLELWAILRARRIDMQAVYLPGEDNDKADRASRVIHPLGEAKLRPEFFQAICRFFRLDADQTIDMFASPQTAQTRLFGSLRFTLGALFVDALSVKEEELPSGVALYAFPPPAILSRFLAKIRNERWTRRIILVHPAWPSATWWTLLARLLCAPPAILSSQNPLLSLPAEQDMQVTVQWAMLASPICGATWSEEASVRMPSATFSLAGATAKAGTTTQLGRPSSSGACQ
ncbi:MAG: reverse transcriptase domain-containing protein [Pseudomonadota bacterium]